ncbi:hypothetical protein QYF61_010890 [Mycteria americana]|uniref:Uncharacterized protein n=1 Tax=Mycteria americana TaxID=33587 RepID=A0AAN7RX05_MYCAM|nr:hypothetical protein QYF61_010890 [Mycteria americana]
MTSRKHVLSCLVTHLLKEEGAAVESDEVSPQPPSLQAEQPQGPQPLPISLVLQTLPQLRCPSLDTLQHLNVSLGVQCCKTLTYELSDATTPNIYTYI